jgi:hypothetical protein
MPQSRRSSGPALVAVGLLVLTLACNGVVIDDPRFDAGAATATTNRLFAPARASFNPVHDMLQTTCGTLDCHGQIGRNLRLYGARGLRLDPKDNSAENPTTAGEYDQSYWSIIGLEPEITSKVTVDGGAHPERLSLFRKARGIERHKGGTLYAPGTAGDRCLSSWFRGEVDIVACKEVSERPRPVPPDPLP